MAIPELLYTNVGGNLLPALPLTDNQFVNEYENIPVAPGTDVFLLGNLPSLGGNT